MMSTTNQQIFGMMSTTNQQIFGIQFHWDCWQEKWWQLGFRNFSLNCTWLGSDSSIKERKPHWFSNSNGSVKLEGWEEDWICVHGDTRLPISIFLLLNCNAFFFFFFTLLIFSQITLLCESMIDIISVGFVVFYLSTLKEKLIAENVDDGNENNG